MKKYLAALSTFVLIALTFPLHQNANSRGRYVSIERQGTGKPYVANRMIVKFRPEAEAAIDRGEMPELGAATRGARLESLNYRFERDGEYLVELDGSVSVEDAVSQARLNPSVEYAEPDYLLYSDAMPNDSRFNEQWALFNDTKAGADISAIRAWDLTTGSSEVVVAVVDTGVDLQHPDLAPNAWTNPAEIPGNGVDDDNNGFVDDVNGWDFVNDRPNTFESATADFHGTHVSGIIGAVGNNGFGTSGVAWNVKLMSLKFIGARTGSTSDAIKAIKYVTEQRRRGVNVRVINASWSGPGESESLFNAIKAAGDEGILFVAAASNGGDDNRGDDIDVDPQFPAAWSDRLDSVISVAAVDRNDEFPSFTNYGHSRVNVAAPGVGVLSTYPGGGYTFLNGTSMATPHVSGIAALLWSFNPSFTPSQVKERITRTAEPILKFASRIKSSGRANAFNALTNTVATSQTRPAIRAVTTSKKVVTIDGLGFIQGTSVVEVNGVALPAGTKYADDFQLANGSFTEISVKLGKATLRAIFPSAQQVSVTVLNTATGERSTPFLFTRN